MYSAGTQKGKVWRDRTGCEPVMLLAEHFAPRIPIINFGYSLSLFAFIAHPVQYLHNAFLKRFIGFA
jgi:hypothetical protein